MHTAASSQCSNQPSTTVNLPVQGAGTGTILQSTAAQEPRGEACGSYRRQAACWGCGARHRNVADQHSVPSIASAKPRQVQDAPVDLLPVVSPQQLHNRCTSHGMLRIKQGLASTTDDGPSTLLGVPPANLSGRKGAWCAVELAGCTTTRMRNLVWAPWAQQVPEHAVSQGGRRT